MIRPLATSVAIPLSICLLLSTTSAYSQLPGGLMDRIRQNQAIEQRQQQELERFQEQQVTPTADADGDELSGEMLEEPPEDDFTLLINKVQIEDCTLLSPQKLQSIQTKYQGRQLGMTDVNNILREITNAYVAKGLITCRAYLPEQDITSGVLVVKAVEGKLESFEEQGPTPTLNTSFAFPNTIESTLNIRDLEQGIDQLNRLPSNDATLEILPGEKFGGSIVGLKNPAAKRWRIVQSIDNSGFESSGQYQERTMYQHDHLLGINDQWTVLYGQDPTGNDDGHFSRMGSASVSVPWGYWLFDLSASYFSYENQIDIPAFDVFAEGDTWAFHAGASHVFHRDQTSISTLHYGFDYKITENFINDLKLITGSRQLAIASIGISDVRPWWGGKLYSNLSVNQGLPIFGAFDDDTDRLNNNQPYGQFTRFIFDAQFTKDLKIKDAPDTNFTWTTNFHAQYSPKALFSSEQIGLGGQGSIRGYRDQSIIADSGVYVRNELSHPVGNLAQKTKGIFGEVSAFGAIDFGHTFGEGSPEYIDGIISGAAGGIRFGDGGKMVGELSVGVPLSYPDFIQDPETVFFFSFGLTL